MEEECVAYEYISINVKSDLEPMYIDCYKNFGWIYINNTKKRDYYINSNANLDLVNIKFKRDSKIKDKERLQLLQCHCENAYVTINKLEKEPQSLATIYALTIAFIAIIFIAFFIISIISDKISWITVLSGIIGIVSSIFPYFVYVYVKIKKETENKSKIDNQQNIIYNTYKQARDILLEND